MILNWKNITKKFFKIRKKGENLEKIKKNKKNNLWVVKKMG